MVSRYDWCHALGSVIVSRTTVREWRLRKSTRMPGLSGCCGVWICQPPPTASPRSDSASGVSYLMPGEDVRLYRCDGRGEGRELLLVGGLVFRAVAARQEWVLQDST
jgi:hypothetical protein